MHIYIYNGTTAIQRHLNREHNIEIGQYKLNGKRAMLSRPANPWDVARSATTSVAPSRHFNEFEYKTKYVDLVITQDISFH